MVISAARLSEVVLARRILASGYGRRVRLAAGISTGEMAAQVQIDLSTYARWEAGTRRPRAAACSRYLTTVIDLLGVTDVDDLERLAEELDEALIAR